MHKGATKKKPRRSSTAKLDLWLVPFTFHRADRDERGSFQIVVEAESPDDAMARCHRRLRELHATTTMFKEPVLVYSTALLRLRGSFPKGLLVNFEVVKEDGSIANLMPDQGMHDAMRFVAGPELENGDAVEAFISFGLDDDADESDPRLAN